MTSATSGGTGFTFRQALILAVAGIGFLFDTYELLMFPVTGSQALTELLKVPQGHPSVIIWSGRMLWIAALCGGIFGLMGGWLIDRFGRKTIMALSIFAYSFSPVAAAYSTSLAMLVFFRCTTFIGVCVELVAAVTWLSELFENKRQRKLVLGWSLALASLGGILVTEVFNHITDIAKTLPDLGVPDGFDGHAAWRYTLLTGLVPGAMILFLLPFVPESRIWAEKKAAGALRRPRIRELFQPGLIRTTLVTTALSACGYAAAFGALQMTPLQLVPGMPDIATENNAVIAESKAIQSELKKLPDGTKPGPELAKRQADLKDNQTNIRHKIEKRRGNIQRWQELGGLLGRIILAVGLLLIASHKQLLRLFLIPGVFLLPITYFYLYHEPYNIFAIAIFFSGLLIVAQFSYMSEYLPRVFPLHLRGTGGSFAANVGGRMFGTMAATLNTEILSPMLTFAGPTPAARIAVAAAIISGSAFALALVLSFLLPAPIQENAD